MYKSKAQEKSLSTCGWYSLPRLPCKRVFIGVVEGKWPKTQKTWPRLLYVLVFLGVVEGKCLRSREKVSRRARGGVFLGVVAGKWSKTRKTCPRLPCARVFSGVVEGKWPKTREKGNKKSTCDCKCFLLSLLDLNQGPSD